MNSIKRIGDYTSGGDAHGKTAYERAYVRKALAHFRAFVFEGAPALDSAQDRARRAMFRGG